MPNSIDRPPAPQGFLFVCDPHLSIARPKARLDDYAGAILKKLEQAAAISRERRLIPIIPGDLFHRAKENDLTLLSRFIEVARTFYSPPWVLSGTHDKHETTLTDADVLSLLGKLEIVKVIADRGFVTTFDIQGADVHLWATPNGQPIDEVIDAKPGFNLMITHHDLDFCGAYPGCTHLTEIKGCDMLVNGHMHKTSVYLTKGQTVCHNPGNIARRTIDQRDHVPAVWAWTPAQGKFLEKILLTVEKNVLNLAGTHVTAASAADLKKTLPRAMRLSHFAELLKDQDPLDSSKSDSTEAIVEELVEVLDGMAAPATLRAYLSALAFEVSGELKVAKKA